MTRNSTLVLEVRDDGNGGVNPQGAGLRGLSDRVSALGGNLVISGETGTGTTLTAVIPMTDGTAA
jgi:signal transduction histidine kinase